MKENPIAHCASLLAQAESSRQPTAPVTEHYPALALRDAYAVQQLNIERRLKAGEVVRGHKIGLTARAMQIKFGVDEPDYGHLLNTMFIADRAVLDLSGLIDPQIEVEPAFVLKSRLMGPNLTADAVLAATDYVCVCFEVIDSRIVDWRIKLQDTVADNGSSALVALSEQRVKPDRLALDDLDTLLEFDGTVVETGNSKDILGHPANGIAWLGNALAPYGIALEAGHVVLPGTCTKSRRVIGSKSIRGYMQGLGDVALEVIGKPTVTKFAS